MLKISCMGLTVSSAVLATLALVAPLVIVSWHNQTGILLKNTVLLCLKTSATQPIINMMTEI